MTLIIIIGWVKWILYTIVALSSTHVHVHVWKRVVFLHFKVLLLLKFIVVDSLTKLIILVLHLFILVKIVIIYIKNILLIYWLNKKRLLFFPFIWWSFSRSVLASSSFFNIFLLIFVFTHVFMHNFWWTKKLSFCWYFIILELHNTRRYYSFSLIYIVHWVIIHHTHLIDSWSF